MSQPSVCPDCGHRNPPGATSCEQCNFPLAGVQHSEIPPPVAGEEPEAPGAEPEPDPTPIVLRRPVRRMRSRASTQVVSLWLLFGVFAALALVWLAIKVNVDRQQQPVEGAREDQQKRADMARAELAKDSTNVAAHIGLADVLYDTGNWSEAIVHYRAAVRRDSSRAKALVDMGVCYYSLGAASDAERLFLLALERDPHQAVALFNLGIVNERREHYDDALKFYHRAMQSSPPPDVEQASIEAIQRIQKQTGKQAPPLPQGG